MESKYKFVRTSIYISLNVLGMLKIPQYRIKYAISLLCFTTFLATGCIIGFITSHGIGNKLTTFSATSAMIAMNLIFVDIFAKRENVLKLLSKMIENKNHREYVLNHANIAMKQRIIWYMVAMMVLALISILPVIYDFLQGSPISEKYSLLIPFWYSCGYNQQLSDTICFRVRTKSELLFSNAVQGSLATIMYLIPCSALIIYSVLINELLAHVDIFKSSVRRLNAMMNRFDTECKKWDIGFEQTRLNKLRHEQKVNEEFIQIIKYQQFIKTCVVEIVHTWKGYAALYVIDYFIVVAMLLFIIVMERNDAALLALKAGCVCAFAFIGFILICAYGHTILDLNEVIFDEICTIPWYQQSPKFRKMYGISLTLNRSKVHMKMIGIYKVNLYTIIALIRSAYSFLNIMLLMSK